LPQFAFTVTDTRGQRTSGTMVATDRDAAMKILSERDLVVTRLTPITSLSQRVMGDGGPRLSGEQLMQLTQQLSAMLDAGMTVKGALDVMLKDTNDPDLRHTLLDLSTGLAAGSSLTELLARSPNIFNEQYVAMVAAGESGGKLPLILQRLAALIEHNEELRRRVRGAMVYPALVLTFSVVIVGGMFVFGVPRFQEIYSGLGGELPWATRVMIGAGSLLARTWPALLAGLVALVAFVYRWVQTPGGRRAWDGFKLRVPLFGGLNRRVAIARFARTLATLQSSGVPIVNSLELVAASMGNVVLEQVVRDSMHDVLQGEPLAEPLRRSGMFTEMAVSMLAAGEHSGQLDVMLDKVGQYYELQVETTLRALTTLVEPIIMIGVGISVGAIIIAMILPIFQLATLLFEK